MEIPRAGNIGYTGIQVCSHFASRLRQPAALQVSEK